MLRTETSLNKNVKTGEHARMKSTLRNDNQGQRKREVLISENEGHVGRDTRTRLETKINVFEEAVKI